jgi:hypothetical protein
MAAHLEFRQRVELFLNLAGAFVAVSLICTWLWCAPRAVEGESPALQIIALALLILILFPVISVTDDLVAAENPAEADSFQRRDHKISGPDAELASSPHSEEWALPLLPAVTWSQVAGLALNVPLPSAPALAPIENRPPPTA